MRIEASNLGVFRGGRLVLRHLDLDVPAGGALVLTGPNGAGKSTLLRLLAGLLRPDAGRIAIGGFAAADDPVAHARRVGFLGHLDAVKPGLDCAANLAFEAATAGLGRPAIAAALEAVGLAEHLHLPARLLSAGQKRRLALARLALRAAPVWLLDEPASGLDAASLDRMAGLLARHRARGGSVVVSTHVALPLDGAVGLALGGDHGVVG